MTVRSLITALTEREISDSTRLRRVVALFQRQLGDYFGNAQVKRRNRRYHIDVAVYEKPLPGEDAGYKMSERQIKSWVRLAAERAHPRLPKRVAVDVGPWQFGRVSKKLFAPVHIVVDAEQYQPVATTG